MMLSHSTRSYELQYRSNTNLVLVDPHLVTMHRRYYYVRRATQLQVTYNYSLHCGAQLNLLVPIYIYYDIL